MFKDKKVIVIMPAYNAAKTLCQTHREVMDQEVVDEVIVVDDGSRDQTVDIARGLPRTRVHEHVENKGYGANQKSCYLLALERGADIIIMVHPGLPVHPQIDSGHGIHDRERPLPLRARVPYSRWPGHAKRDAGMEIPGQPLSDTR